MQSSIKHKIILLIVRGIRDQTKTRSNFTYLKDQKTNFYFLLDYLWSNFLKETYSNDESMWQSEWGVKFFFSWDTP